MKPTGLLIIFENRPTSILAEKLFQQLDAEEYNTLFALLEEREEIEKIEQFKKSHSLVTKEPTTKLKENKHGINKR